MTTKKVYIGSVGPFLFDDSANLNDFDGDFSGETLKAIISDKQFHITEAPSADEEIMRQVDVGALILSPQSVTDIDNPTELNSLAGTAGASVLCYEVVAATDYITLYMWDSADSGGANSPYVLAASGGGFWTAVAGRYCAWSPGIEELTVSLLVETDGSKRLASVSKQAHITDASTQDLTGGDTIDQTKLESDLAGIVGKINTILVALETLKALNTA